MLMAYEATSDLALEPVEIETPLERTTGRRVSGKKLTLVPILRAGLGMVEGILKLVPSARVGHIGLYRDHETLEPVDYYFKIPRSIRSRRRAPFASVFFAWSRRRSASRACATRIPTFRYCAPRSIAS